jgi:hypothetical protein
MTESKPRKKYTRSKQKEKLGRLKRLDVVEGEGRAMVLVVVAAGLKPPPTQMLGIIAAGTKFKKVFDEGTFKGTVLSHDASTKLYSVRLERQ